MDSFATSQVLYGSAQRIIRYRDDKMDYFPGIFNEKGDAEPIVVDDRYSFMLYHRLNGSSTSRVARTGFGDSAGWLQNVYAVGLYSFWDMRKLNTLQDEMQMLLMGRIPGRLDVRHEKDIAEISINWGNTVFNNQQIYESEYNTARFNIPSNFSMLMMNYTVSIIFNPDCYKRCP